MNMKRLTTIMLACLMAMPALFAQGPQPEWAPAVTGKIDPYMKAFGGYGYMLEKNCRMDVWWAEAAYKVMNDTPLPKRTAKQIDVKLAKNEAESFIVVVRPKRNVKDFTISVDDFKCGSNILRAADQVELRIVDSAKVWNAANAYSYTGMWPDPLPLYKGAMTLKSGRNYAFWITVKAPAGAAAGEYRSSVRISADKMKKSLPVNMKVWNFELPRVPSMKSDVGVSTNDVCKRENIKPEHQADMEKLVKKFFEDYKITMRYAAPANIPANITGVDWKGGLYDENDKFSGNFSMRVEKPIMWDRFCASPVEPIKVSENGRYTIAVDFKYDEPGNGAAVRIECLDANGESLDWDAYEEQTVILSEWAKEGEWCRAIVDLKPFPKGTTAVELQLCPFDAAPYTGRMGTARYDNLKFFDRATDEDLLCGKGDFEVDFNKIEMHVDVDSFAEGVNQMFEDYGFNTYTLILDGIGAGSAKFQIEGSMAGFQFGTWQYEKLMEKYLSQVQDGLERNGLLGREITYWFDEPWVHQYPFVDKYHKLMKKYAPKIHTFLTEHLYVPEYNDCNDIACMKWNFAVQSKIDEMLADGRECWSYICCDPRAPYICEMLDADAINFRVWLWGSWMKNLTGVLLWHSNYWSFDVPEPADKRYDERGNPAPDFSYNLFHGWAAGYGDGVMFYPNNPDYSDTETEYLMKPVPSIRLELMRDGIEDYEYFVMLKKAIENAPASKADIAKEAEALLTVPYGIYTNEYTYCKSPLPLISHRNRMGDFIEKLQ